jgi:Tol biopolymer transport system component/DNA-binding winged helix-turn-helix (wHTH) protein
VRLADPRAGFDDRLYRFGPFVADPVAGNLYRDGSTVPLSSKTFEALIVLLEHRGSVVDKDTLFKRIWPDIVVEENTLARLISTLRKALDDDPKHHHYIRTVSGRGYRFAAPVHEATRGELASLLAPSSSPAPEPVAWTDDATHELARPDAPRRSFGIAAGAAAVLSFIVLSTVFFAPARVPSAAAERKLWQFASSGGLDSDPAWDPTGQSIAYASDRGGNLDIWVQSMRDDGRVRLTSSAAQDWQPSWSSDGRMIAFRSERDGGGVFIMPAAGGPERRVATFGHQPQFSPRQPAILFYGSSVMPSTLYVVGTDGGEPRRVWADLLVEFGPFRAAWHPDGTRISVFGMHRKDGPSFWTGELDGSGIVRSAIEPAIAARLYADRVTLADFAWSPSGDALYFEGKSDEAVNIFRIRVIPATLAWQSGPERLTVSTRLDTDVSLSPDGTRFVFTARDETTRLWSFPFDANRGVLRGPGEPMTRGGTNAVFPDISANGTDLVYRTVRRGKHEVRRRSLVDGEDLVISATDGAVGPRWSPDGRFLAFRQVQPSPRRSTVTQNAVVLVSADGGEQRFLTELGPLEVTPFDWSADGNWVLASCEHGPAGMRAVCLLPVSSAPQAQKDVQIIASDPERHLYQATFSPDQRWIAFIAVSRPSGTSAICVIDADGNQWTSVSDGTFWDDKPRWSPDGKTIFFLSNRSGFANLWGRRFNPVSGKPEGEPFRVTSFDSPTKRMPSPIVSTEFAIAADRLILPVVEASGSVWVLENVDR